MSPPLTALFEEATCNVCAWNNALLPDEQYQRLYQEIMTSDVALNPTCTPTYPQEVASLTQSPDMYPSQTTFGWDLNDKLQGIEGQKDLAHSGPAQMERPGLTEHGMESIVAGVVLSQDLDNALRLPRERPPIPLLPPQTQNLQPDTGVGSERTYAQVLRDPYPAQVNGHLALNPPTADISQNAGFTPAQDLELALRSQRPHHAARGGHLIKCEPGLRLSDAITKDVGLDSSHARSSAPPTCP
ncbi:hypothetical protein KC340_g12912 [Hortaea werneckii]|nr:hypothetical protein KC342_g8647 [Hortaea werneckii]KAI7235840.1 hypothetical protein KC365_g5404 [Hortaea werneckii]KAI7301898.1 hypothetical protein KC340_g12912 [Hortaea werneckii]KAI7399031.1 hypothetical protein KC328_g4192 [Hortaea werneckii]